MFFSGLLIGKCKILIKKSLSKAIWSANWQHSTSCRTPCQSMFSFGIAVKVKETGMKNRFVTLWKSSCPLPSKRKENELDCITVPLSEITPRISLIPTAGWFDRFLSSKASSVIKRNAFTIISWIFEKGTLKCKFHMCVTNYFPICLSGNDEAENKTVIFVIMDVSICIIYSASVP